MTDYFTIKESADELMELARRQSAIPHIRDDDIHKPLLRYLAAANSEARLSEEGARELKKRILRILKNRLRMFRDFENHPEIAEQKIEKPLFLCGPPRTGSTKLHKLLAASGDFKYLELWKVFNPSLITGDREEDPAQRIAETDEFVAWYHSKIPNIRSLHEIKTHEPEEEAYIMEHCQLGTFTASVITAPDIFIDAHEHYSKELEYLKQTLQYLQWQFHPRDDRPWVLKWPSHSGREHQILEVFEDAQFAMTHRHPQSLCASIISVLLQYLSAYTAVSVQQLIEERYHEYFLVRLDSLVQSRAAHPDIDIYDVSFSRLTQDAMSVVTEIYQHIGMSADESTLQALAQWEQNQVREYSSGKGHRYSLEDFGLTDAQLVEINRGYIERFKSYF